MKIRYAVLLAGFAIAQSASAGTHVWSGAGANKLWSNAANWSSGGVPSPNEAAPVIIEIPAAISGGVTNNIAGLKVDSLRLLGSGQVIRAAGAGTLVLRGGNSLTNVSSAGINYLDSTLLVTLEGTVRVAAPVLLTFLNSIGGDGGIEIDGTVSFSGESANTYNGATVVKSGNLTLNNALLGVGLVAVPGPLTIQEGRVTLSRDQAISSDSAVTVETGGVLDLNGHDNTIAALTLSGGSVETDAGVLTVVGPITAQGFGGTIAGNFSLGSSTRTFEVGPLATLTVNAIIRNGNGISHPGIAKTGSGTLRLMGANTFTGAVNIFGGTIEVGHASALGSSFLFGATVGAGNVLRVLNGVTVAAETLTLNGGSLYGQGSVTWAGPVILGTNSHVRSLAPGNELRITGPISGPGGFVHAGQGRLNLGGTNANTFAGEVIFTEGDLWLTKLNSQTAIPGTLTVGSGANSDNENTLWIDRADQVADDAPVTLLSSAALWLNNVNETIGDLVLDGAEVNTGIGTLTLNGNVTAQLSSDLSKITGRLSLGGAPRTFNVFASPISPAMQISAVISGLSGTEFRKTGAGELRFTGANTYPGRTEVYGGILSIAHDQALGQADNGGGNQHPTVVFNGGTVAFENANIAGENLGLLGHGFNGVGALLSRTGNNACSGSIQVTTDITINVLDPSSLTLGGSLYDDGDVIKRGEGLLIFGGFAENGYTGATLVEEGSLYLAKPDNVTATSGRLVVGNDSGSPARVRLLGDNPFRAPSKVILRSGGILEVNGHAAATGSLEGNGQVTLGSGNLNLSGGDFAGTISGSGTIQKYINSALRLGGTNTYTGGTIVHGGRLIVDGALVSSAVRVEPGATLAGCGYVAGASLDDATLSPGGTPVIGGDVFDIATLRLGSLVLTNGSKYRFETRESAAGGWERDQVEVSGLTRVTGATLEAHLGATGATNIAYMILKLTGNDAIQGTFGGLPQAGTMIQDGASLEIDYFSGTGNDVVLRQSSLATNDFTVRLLIERLPDTTIQLTWPAWASNYELQTHTNLTGDGWTAITPFHYNAGDNTIAHYSTHLDDAPQRFFRLMRQPEN